MPFSIHLLRLVWAKRTAFILELVSTFFLFSKGKIHKKDPVILKNIIVQKELSFYGWSSIFSRRYLLCPCCSHLAYCDDLLYVPYTLSFSFPCTFTMFKDLMRELTLTAIFGSQIEIASVSNFLFS